MKQRLRVWLGISNCNCASEIQSLKDRVRLLELPPAKEELTAIDIAKKHEQKAAGRKPWRVIQREAELANSPEIQRDIRIDKERKEISDAS